MRVLPILIGVLWSASLAAQNDYQSAEFNEETAARPFQFGLYGFQAGMAQSPETLDGIVLLMSFIPAVFGIIGGAIMVFYPLTDRMMETIEQDLTARHAAAT